MTVRKTVAIGAAIGLAVSIAVLALTWKYGIWQLMVGEIDLRVVLWPSSVMVPIVWCCTAPELFLTTCSVAINGLIYAGIALLVRTGLRAVKPHREVREL